LLWRGHPNPTLDAEVYVPLVDFASFLYQSKQCHCRPGALAEVMEQLAKLYMTLTYVSDFPKEPLPARDVAGRSMAERRASARKAARDALLSH
jgi:hypothetical protein